MRVLLLLLLAPLALAAEPAPPETVKVRVVSWDVGWRPPSARAWTARVAEEVRDAARGGVDALVFPELFAWGLAPYAPKGQDEVAWIGRRWHESVMPAVAKAAAPGMLVALGSYPHREAGREEAFNRAMILADGRWRAADKLDPTQPERLEKPPIAAGRALPLIRFRGGAAAVLICFSMEMPEVSAALKKAGVQLVLGPSSTEDEDGVARILRTASARAVELGAAVVVAPLLGEQDGWKSRGSAALFLPAQKGVASAPQESARREAGIHRDDFTVPWRKLLELRVQPADKPETRPFLAHSPAFELVTQ